MQGLIEFFYYTGSRTPAFTGKRMRGARNAMNMMIAARWNSRPSRPPLRSVRKSVTTTEPSVLSVQLDRLRLEIWRETAAGCAPDAEQALESTAATTGATLKRSPFAARSMDLPLGAFPIHGHYRAA